MFGDIVSGAGYFFRGFKLVRKRGIRRYVLVPLLINILVFVAAILIGIDQYENLLNWFLPGGNRWWAEFARIVLWVFFAIATLVLLFFTFTVLANIIGAPFNGLLSEKVESLIAGRNVVDSEGIVGFVSTIIPSVLSEFRKLGYFLMLAAFVFLLTIIPVINVISPFLWFVFSSWMIAVEYVAYPMENHRLYFSQVKDRLRQDRWMAIGFGMVGVAAGLIPLVNFFVMPAAVAGGTAMWVERLSGRVRESKVDLK